MAFDLYREKKIFSELLFAILFPVNAGASAATLYRSECPCTDLEQQYIKAANWFPF